MNWPNLTEVTDEEVKLADQPFYEKWIKKLD